MKTIIKLLVLLLLLYQSNDTMLAEVQNKDIASYFGENSCWSYLATIYSSDLDGFFPPQSVQTHLQGDTLINQMHYLKFEFGFDHPIREFTTCGCSSSYQLITFAKDNIISFFDPVLAPQWDYCGNVVDVFPRGDAIWNIQINGQEHYYGLSGDTIINDIPYNKLYLLNDTTLNIDSNDEYVGGFRQEGKKVWFRPSLPDDYIDYDNPQYPRETLLYDFSKNVGDTIWHNLIPDLHIYYWAMGDSIAASIIESIDIDEQERKIYHTRQYVYDKYHNSLHFSGRQDEWIEGIGSIHHGLFWFLNGMTLSGRPGLHLACFKQGNEVKYVDNTCNICFYEAIVGFSDKNSIPLEVVYENNDIQIQGESLVFPCELKLFSPIGQLILEKKLQSDKEKIPVNQLKGIYLYQVQKNKESVKTGKIMIK